MNPAALAPEVRQAALEKVTAELWRRGNLKYKLDQTQLRIREAIDKHTGRKFFLLCSRRLGKSFSLVVLAFETALKKPNARIVYLAPTGKDAAEIVTDICDQAILLDCPEALRPHYNPQTKVLTFKNGSVIRFKGVNAERADDLRGGAADLVILDECGTMDDLNYVQRSVVMPP